ncbi:hypothetical protein [Paenibacillus sp. NPDC093718]|uniref:hypothetical protein n=1 Tax=Paenibacillus sp. NPDC093718 TaxID=3390601 RepID=UPI003D02C1C6
MNTTVMEGQHIESNRGVHRYPDERSFGSGAEFGEQAGQIYQQLLESGIIVRNATGWGSRTISVFFSRYSGRKSSTARVIRGNNCQSQLTV